LSLKLREVVTAHGQHQVEALEVSGLDPPRAQGREVVAASRRGLAGTPVRPFADVIVVRTGGIELDPPGQPGLGKQATGNTFGHGRTADVSGAHEQHAQRRVGQAGVHAVSPASCASAPNAR
jgi:hypothetical protein